MSTVTITTGIDRAAHLIPFDARNLQGNYGAVLSRAEEMPDQLRDAQQRRRDTYMTTGSRSEPADAPRYFVTSYGVLIAWVTMDGRTHYASNNDVVQGMYVRATQGLSNSDKQYVTALRHRDAVRAVWPDQFAPFDN